MILKTLLLSTFIIGAFSRSAPFPIRCYSPFHPDNRCASDIHTNIGDYVSESPGPIYINPYIMDEACRLGNHYGSCLRVNFVNDQCPIEFVTVKDIILRMIPSLCDTYKEDLMNAIRCFNNDMDVHNATLSCAKGITFDGNPGNDKCGYMYDQVYNCLTLMKTCESFDSGKLLQFLKEAQPEVCYAFNLLFIDT